jgi:hypothetical protein
MCFESTEYCAMATVNGAVKIAECRPYQFGCSSCDCARADAASQLKREPACANVMASGLVCTDGNTMIGPSGSSPTLVVSCVVP